MKHTINVFFIIVILILMALPVLFFSHGKKISEKENRNLAEKPRLCVDNRLNKKLFAESDAYLTDHFGFRDKLIKLNTINPVKVKSPVNTDTAIKGKNGWYFYIDAADGNNLLDFYKRNLFSKSEAEEFSKQISETVSWCNENNIPCLFIICPNKHSVYEENFPFNRPAGKTRTDQITEIFDKLDISYIFPRDYLISQKKYYPYPLYYETDTHWNSQGAYLASTLIKDKIKEIFPDTDFPDIVYDYSIKFSMTNGDLLPMLGVEKSKSTIVQVFPVKSAKNNNYTYLEPEVENDVHTKGSDEKLPRAIIFRDSFFSPLEPFVSPLFSEALYKWKHFQESDKKLVLQYKPDIIIFESVERYAQRIIY